MNILNMKSVTKLRDTGYCIGVSIPWTDKARAAEGNLVGFDVQANDTMVGYRLAGHHTLRPGQVARHRSPADRRQRHAGR